MADLTIRIPAEHADSVRDSLLHVYGTVAEALHNAAADLAASHREPDDVRGYRVELGDIEDALEQVGWDYAPAEAPIELTAHPELMSDLLAALVLDAAEAFDDTIEPCRRGEKEMAVMWSALRSLSGAVELFAEAQEGPQNL